MSKKNSRMAVAPAHLAVLPKERYEKRERKNSSTTAKVGNKAPVSSSAKSGQFIVTSRVSKTSSPTLRGFRNFSQDVHVVPPSETVRSALPDVDLVVVTHPALTGEREAIRRVTAQIDRWIQEGRVTRPAEPRRTMVDGEEVIDVELYVPRQDWLDDRHRELRQALRALQTDRLTIIPSIVPELRAG